MNTGYEQIYLGLLPRLAECDLAESAGRLGLAVSPTGEVTVRFCAQQFVITAAGINPVNGRPVHVNCRSVLAYYVLSKGRGEPEGSFVPLSRMTGTIEGRNSQTHGILVKPMLREFGRNYERFCSAALAIGGVLEGASNDGGHCWYFQVLPKIPVRLIFYEADEEFPADIQIWLDRSASRFLEFECLAFLIGCFTSAILEAARNTPDSEFCELAK